MHHASSEQPEPESVLDEAERIVSGARNSSYGHPKINHQNTADIFNAMLRARYGSDVPHLALDAVDVCLFNIAQKLARLGNSLQRDSLVDVAGYVRNIEIITGLGPDL